MISNAGEKSNKTDGKAAVFEGPERGGGMSPEVMERLVADEEFMDSVSS